MQVIIDRVEGDKILVELPDMTIVTVPLSLFPEAKEGDIYKIIIDKDNPTKQKNKIQDKFNKLKED